MYESTEVQPQDETSFEQFMSEVGNPPMTEAELDQWAAWCDEQQLQQAFRDGFDPFSGETVDDFYARLAGRELVS